MQPLAPLFALALAAPAVAQSTWIVDDDPGPGVDFTDLPPAVAAAGPWDTLVVRDGTYSSTTIAQGLRIVGEGTSASWVFHDLTIRDVPASQMLVVAGLRIVNDVRVERCDGVVVLEDVYADSLAVDASHDVRLQRYTAWSPPPAGNTIVGSRVELVDSDVRGRYGFEGTCVAGGDGEVGLDVDASFVHAAASAIRGGDGAYCNEAVLGCCFGFPAATGGLGLDALDSQVVLTGSALGHGVFGGAGGMVWRIWQAPDCPCGDPGGGLLVDGLAASQPALRLSGVQVTGDPPQTVGAAVSVTHATGDPLLLLTGPVVPGQMLPLEVRGTPGQRVQLDFGRNATRSPVPGSAVEQLTSAERQVQLGNVPPSGVLHLALNVPAAWPTGTVFFMQTRLTDPATGATRMSNSTPFVVR